MSATTDLSSFSEKDKLRFWSKIEKGDSPNDCWIWMAAKNEDGYGQFRAQGRTLLAHRIAFFISGGVFENGPLVTHGPCNNRACCNPNHLSSGTHQTNSDDMIFRDGTLNPPRGDEHGSRKKPETRSKGDQNGRAKLSEADVLKIRSRHAVGGIAQRRLASEFGVTHPQIGRIIHRKLWAHI